MLIDVYTLYAHDMALLRQAIGSTIEAYDTATNARLVRAGDGWIVEQLIWDGTWHAIARFQAPDKRTAIAIANRKLDKYHIRMIKAINPQKGE